MSKFLHPPGWGNFFMLRKLIYIIIVILSFALAQQSSYRNKDDIKGEWEDYTSYQRDEMVSFCDFLFKEQYYERCLLTSFQFLYRFPNDPIESVVLYHIARCYEEMGNYELSQKFYRRVQNVSEFNSVTFKASQNREHFVLLKDKQLTSILNIDDDGKNPYTLLYKGYASLELLSLVEARQYFIEAEKQFNHPHYSKLLAPIYQTIENIQDVSQYNKLWVWLSGVAMPGGGHLLLKEWFDGHGILLSALSMVMMNRIGDIPIQLSSILAFDSPKRILPIVANFEGEAYELKANDALPKEIGLVNSDLKYTIPPLVFALGIYGGSIWQANKSTAYKNKGLMQRFIHEEIASYGVSQFIDFDEPTFLEK